MTGRRDSNVEMTTKEVYALVETLRHELKNDFDRLEEKSDKIYVKVEAFDPVRRIVYGLVGIILTTLAIALLSLLVDK